MFVGSCTNGRIEDLRAVAEILRGRQVAEGVRMLVVPGSVWVKQEAEAEGLGEIFTAAGAEWREAGCSMCLAMNPDKLTVGERAASTSTATSEGRQGPGGRTHPGLRSLQRPRSRDASPRLPIWNPSPDGVATRTKGDSYGEVQRP